MSKLLRVALMFAVLFHLSVSVAAQSTPKETSAGTASLTGRITVEGKAAAGITVVAATPDYGPLRKTFARSVTDAEGRFQLVNIPAGRVSVQPLAASLVASKSTSEAGKTIAVAEGETIEHLDFALARGGVITGRVTQQDGQPVIGEHITTALVDETGKKIPSYSFKPFQFDTDDRGVYRVYGLRAGRYLVSVGQTKGTIRVGYGGHFYPQTFHPGVTDEAKATIIEVAAGAEATGVDITLDPPTRTFAATGRIIDAETGKPVPGMAYAYGTYKTGEKQLGGLAFTNVPTNAKGEFRIEGLFPDKYAAFAFINGASGAYVDSYSDPVTFEITEGDISGLEIKLHRGASISGVAVLENPNDQSALAQLSKLQLYASNLTPDFSNFLFSPQSDSIKSDGSFRLAGLRSGKIRIVLSGYPPVKGFSLARVERNGAEQRDGIELGAGEQLTGVRLVLAYGSGVVRGQVEIENGALPEGARLSVTAQHSGDAQRNNPFVASVDERNRFLIEGLPSGTYELILKARIFSASNPQTPPRDVAAPVKQTVTVNDNAETQATFTLDLSAISEEKAP